MQCIDWAQVYNERCAGHLAVEQELSVNSKHQSRSLCVAAKYALQTAPKHCKNISEYNHCDSGDPVNALQAQANFPGSSQKSHFVVHFVIPSLDGEVGVI